jgi:serralysin
MQQAETAALAASDRASAQPPAAAPPINVLEYIDWGGGVLQTGRYDENGRMIVGVFFAGAADSEQVRDWSPEAKAAVFEALAQYEKIINVVFVESSTEGEVNFVISEYNRDDPSERILGYFMPPGEENAGRGVFNFDDPSWTPAGLAVGGYAFNTLIHEFGHGLGLKHPHDDGPGGAPVMPGIDGDRDPGDLFSPGGQFSNQGVWTVMSYVDGWYQHPQGNIHQNAYGNIAGPMAWDIALLQQKYGANMTWATGDDTYVLPAADGVGTYYSSIWDAGGSDWIVAGEAMDVTIDLRAASLLFEDGGAGWVSHAEGVHGGFTIANGVVIENAEGGAGADLLIGNGVHNFIRGGAGADTLAGLGDNDFLNGGEGDDRLVGGDGHDTAGYYDATAGVTVRLTQTTRQNTVGAGRDLLEGIESVMGSDFNDILSGDAGDNQLYGLDGDDRLDGLDGDDRLSGGVGNDRLVGGDGDDELTEWGDGADSLYGGAGNDDFNVNHFFPTGKVVADGGEGDDTFFLRAPGGMTYAYGGAGNDTFHLLYEATVTGGAGIDTFHISQDVVGSGAVNFTDFQGGAGGDILRLSLLSTLQGWDTFSNPFTSGYLRLIASGTGSLLQIDVDGAATAFAFTTVVVFKNLALNALTIDNLDYAPPTIILGTAGADNLAGGKADDTILGLAGADILKGNAGQDSIDGGDGNDLLYGLSGDDSLLGGAGVDKLTAGDGRDTLDGGTGNDQLIGGLGGDVMTGGIGADLFAYTVTADSQAEDMDLIVDFATGAGDRVSLAGIDADTGAAGNQAFAFASAFTGVAGQLVRVFDADSGRTTVSGDVDGDGQADLVFQLVGDRSVSTVGWLL